MIHEDDDFDYDHGQQPTDAVLADQIAGKVAERHKDQDKNLDLIRDDFIEEYSAAVESGAIWAPSRKQLAAKLAWKQANDRARRRAEKVVVDLRSGQLSMSDMSTCLTSMIIVGKQRRVSLRTLTAADVRMMIESRNENAAKAVRSASIFEDAGNWLIQILERYGDFGQSFGSGAFGVAV